MCKIDAPFQHQQNPPTEGIPMHYSELQKKRWFIDEVAQTWPFGGSVGEFSPATREAWVRFPANAAGSPLGFSSTQPRAEEKIKGQALSPRRGIEPRSPA